MYSVEDCTLIDADGHALFLRGINVREDAKHVPEHLIPLSDAEVALIRKHGFNSVRLLTHWEAVMPADGQVDREYLDDYAAEVDELCGAGLLVIVDMHQDLWGSPFSNGGAEWTCPEEIREGYEPQSPWWLNYASEQVRGCFDRFWADEDGIQDKWLSAWTAVAAAVCHQDLVLGFDLFNEPYPGSALADPRFDAEVLYPFYRRAMDAIEAICPERIFFLEPSGGFALGFADHMEIIADDLRRVVVAPHFYPQEVHESGRSYDKDFDELKAAFDNAMDGYSDGASPLWVGEYGGLSQNQGFENYLEHITTVYYRGFVGSALWAFNKGDGGFAWLDSRGMPKEVFDRAWSVPVPVRLPDRPSRMEPDFDRRALSLAFDCHEGRELTVLLPASGAWKVDIDPGGLESAGQEEDRLRLVCQQNRSVDVEIAPDQEQ